VLFVPYAALTAALVGSPRRHWIWYIVAGAVTHALASLPHWSWSWVVFADVANITRAVVAAVMLRRFFDGPPRLASISALSLFVVSAVIVAPAVGATIGATNNYLHGAALTFFRPWSAWFASNALTGLTMLPMFLSAVRNWPSWRRRRLDPRRAVEAVALVIALAVGCIIVLNLEITNRWDLSLVLHGPLPLLIWAALRFGPGGASLALTAVAFASIVSADRAVGPFMSADPDDRVLTLQLFIFLTALPVLCIAAVGGARHGAVQLYRALLASLQDHVAILDARGVVLEVNDSWQRFADAGHHCPFDRARAGDDYLAACRSAIDTLLQMGKSEHEIVPARALVGMRSVLNGERRRFEMEYEQEFESAREWYVMRVEALERSDGGAVVTRANVSARRRAQMEIEEQRRELSHLARVGVLGQLSGALAHELSQPLSSILSNAEAARHLIQRRPVDIEELRAILHDIVHEDRRAAQVIDGLRALLKRGETRVQPVDTAELVREVMELAHAELITRRVTATATLGPNLPPVLADRVQLQQVLLNLILNACEAMGSTPDGERLLQLTATAAGANDVRFSIRDGGSGIPPARVERLFEPFVTTKPEGLGLGLSIARTIIAAHGGRIWAENNATRGVTVHCVLGAAPSNSVVSRAPRLSPVPFIRTRDLPDALYSPSAGRERGTPSSRS
ncbi:MAG: ATP-binding protein, partial [bacterium]